MSPNKNYIGAGMIAIAIVLFWSLALPFWNRISDLDEALRERDNLLSSRSAIMANIQELNKEYQKRLSDIAKLSTVVPSKKSVAEILSTIDNVSLKNGMELFRSAISDQKNYDETNPYNLLNIEMSLNGSYGSLVNFLKTLESSLRLVDIASIDAATSLETSSVLNLVVKGNAYYLK